MIQGSNGSQELVCLEKLGKIKIKRPLHNRKNFAVATEKIFQVTLVARHFNRKW
ncbi:hypothetical protein SAMN05216406_1321, partial [Nitrosomonas ureae]